MVASPKINDGGTKSPDVMWHLNDALAYGLGECTFSRTRSGLCTTVEDVEREAWDGPTPFRVLPDVDGAGAALAVVSDDATDTLAGVGAQRVLVTYIEAGTLFERFGIAEMDGLTPAAVNQAQWVKVNQSMEVQEISPAVPVLNAVRVNRMKVCDVGTSDYNVGGIDATIGGAVQNRIPGTVLGRVGYNRDAAAFAFCPRGSNMMLTGTWLGSSQENSGIRSCVVMRMPGSSVRQAVATMISRSDANLIDRARQLPPGSEVVVRINDAGGGDEAYAATFSMIEVYDLKADPSLHLRPQAI